MPSWLLDSPVDFDEVLKPPSYLIASLQQAFDDYAYHHDPPTYEHSVGRSAPSTSTNSPATRRQSLAGESIWEDSDDEEDGLDGSSADADDEEGSAGETEDGELEERRDGKRREPEPESPASDQSTLYRMPLNEFPAVPSTSSHSSSSTPTPPDEDSQRSFRARPLPPIPHIPPPAYHLLHLQHLINTSDADPYSELARCLSALDPLLLLKPFSVFAEVCYEDAVRGDASTPILRPFSPPPPPPSMSHSSGLTDESEDDDEELLRSPTQASMGPISPADTIMPPLVYDPRSEERVRGASSFSMPLHIPRTMSPPPDDLSSPVTQGPKHHHVRFVSKLYALPQDVTDVWLPIHQATADPLTEVASLFLHTPVPVKVQDSVSGFPTRARPPPSRPSLTLGNMRGMLLRSLNIN